MFAVAQLRFELRQLRTLRFALGVQFVPRPLDGLLECGLLRLQPAHFLRLLLALPVLLRQGVIPLGVAQNRVALVKNCLHGSDFVLLAADAPRKLRGVAGKLLRLLLFFPKLRLFREKFGLLLLQAVARRVMRRHPLIQFLDALRQFIETAFVFGLM